MGGYRDLGLLEGVRRLYGLEVPPLACSLSAGHFRDSVALASSLAEA